MLDVLIPFFGDPTLMRLATTSVLEQSRPPDRVIIVDDCYPDESIGSWARSLPAERVTYFRNARNLGANANYRWALDQSDADYVVFMGADDVMGPRFVERSLELIHEFHHPEVIQGGVEVIDAEGRAHLPLADRIKGALRPRGRPTVAIGGDRATASLLRGNWTYFPSLVWRRDAVYDAGFRSYDIVQDLALVVDVLRRGGRLVVDDEPTFKYRRHASSDSGVQTVSGKRFQEERDYFANIQVELNAQDWNAATRAARWHLTSRLHAAALLPEKVMSRDWAGAVSHLRHAGSS